MAGNSLSGSHIHRHDLHDPLTFGHCQQSTTARHEATPSSMSDTGVASVLHTGAIALPIGTLFGGDHVSAPNSIPDLSMQYNNGSAPTDGELVWYCSGCNDGPIAWWQSVCVVCSHQRCGQCNVEETC